MAMPGFINTQKKDNKIYEFVQLTNFGTVITTSNVATVGYARAWMLSDLVQASSFTAIFDQYRLAKCEVWFTPESGSNLTPVANIKGSMYSAVDYDDDTSTNLPATLQQKENCISAPFQNGHHWIYVPHVAMAAYSGAFSSFANVSAPWIDVASASVKHYGIKAVVDATTNAGDILVQIQARFTFQFRNVI